MLRCAFPTHKSCFLCVSNTNHVSCVLQRTNHVSCVVSNTQNMLPCAFPTPRTCFLCVSNTQNMLLVHFQYRIHASCVFPAQRACFLCVSCIVSWFWCSFICFCRARRARSSLGVHVSPIRHCGVCTTCLDSKAPHPLQRHRGSLRAHNLDPH